MKVSKAKASAMHALFRAKSYVLVTDKVGEMFLQVKRPETLKNKVEVATQRTVLEAIGDNLSKITKQFDAHTEPKAKRRVKKPAHNKRTGGQ